MKENEVMSEPKNKKKKPDLLVTILSIALIAFVIVFTKAIKMSVF